MMPKLKKETPVVIGVRELTQEDVDNAQRKMAPVVKKLRDRHHHLAKLFAMGLRPWEIAERGGFSIAYVSVIQTDPAFQELVAKYKTVDLESFRKERDEYYAMVNHGRNMSARQLNDQLEEADETGEKIPIGNLLRIHDSYADRSGYGKQTNYTVKLDFADALDRAMAEAKKVKESRTLTLVANPTPLEQSVAREPPKDVGGAEEFTNQASPVGDPQPRLIDRRF